MSQTQVSFGVVALAVLGLGTALVVAGGPPVRAADHGDSPAVRVDTRLDINDVYCFASPENASNTVIVMTVCPVAGITAPAEFAPRAKYQFAVDTNGDAKEDQVYSLTFGPPNREGVQAYTLTGPGRLRVRGSTGALDVAVGTAGKVFAGLRDDPFFFDLIGFRRNLAFAAGTSRNFFDGLNTMAIVLEVPSASFGATSIGVWARTLKGSKQVDRMGRPAINTVLVGGGDLAGTVKKDQFNRSLPRNDARDWTAEVVAHLKTLGNTDQEAAALAAVLLPDVLTYDTTDAGGFLNGRKLDDDVIDAELNLLSKGAVTTDFVANDSTFLPTFPYLGTKN